MKFQHVKGMPDILPEEMPRWRRLEGAVRRMAELHGFSEIRTPVVEHTELFRRATGETTEVVEKQMFSMERDGRSLSLRPEGTPACARAYITNTIYAKEPVTRWYYLGPMFRAEQPQRGRLRQFHQAGFELYGDPGPVGDAEIIDMLTGLMLDLGVQGVKVRVNSLGGTETRIRYREELLAYLRPQAQKLSAHAQERFEQNPLRVLDSKHPDDRAVSEGAPSIIDVLTDDDRAHWRRLLASLEALGTPFEIDKRLVRGLDYYTRTAFEVTGTGGGLGSQDALAAGGRYDGLLEALGAPQSIPGIGFAIGLERLLLTMADSEQPKTPLVLIAPLGEGAQLEALRIARSLRKVGVVCELDGREGSLKSKLRRANSMGARACVILGESEVSERVAQLKDLSLHTQDNVPLAALQERIVSLLATAPNEATS